MDKKHQYFRKTVHMYTSLSKVRILSICSLQPILNSVGSREKKLHKMHWELLNDWKINILITIAAGWDVAENS